MPRWTVEIRVVEIGRTAVIDAPTKAEAIHKLRRREWEYLTDEARAIVTKVGPMLKEE